LSLLLARDSFARPLSGGGRYDSDSSGEIDINELRTAIKDWARFAKVETARKEAARQAMVARKQQLKAERAESLANADSRAAEIIEVCTAACGGDSITVMVFNSHLLPVPKYHSFASWMLKGRAEVFKRHDVDKSGTIDLDELQAALGTSNTRGYCAFMAAV
jgi:Ca2+-binding EF-hand superfamily protein